MYFHSFNIGYIDVPNCNTLNIYTVGCPHKCIGCHAEDLQDINNSERKELTVDLIKLKLSNGIDKRSRTNFFNGICWLGGDPLFQWSDFIKINNELKNSEYNNLYRIAYTGWKYKELSNEEQYELVQCIDVLIDGPWQGIQLGQKNCNQKIYFNIDNKYLEEVSYTYFNEFFKTNKFKFNK